MAAVLPRTTLKAGTGAAGYKRLPGYERDAAVGSATTLKVPVFERESSCYRQRSQESGRISGVFRHSRQPPN